MPTPRTPRPAAPSGVCACAPPSKTSSPPHAIGVDAPLKVANLKQLRRIEGQVRGIAAMIQDDRSCADIINQVSAVRQSLHTVARNLMRNHIKHCGAAAMQKDGQAQEAMIEELLGLVGKIAR